MRQVQGLPDLAVVLAGRRLTDAEMGLLVAITVNAVLGRPTQCLATWVVDDPGVDPATGDSLRVDVGGHRLFTGEVTVVEYAYAPDTGRQVRLRAYDALHRLRKRQHNRLHADIDLRSLAVALTEGTGLSVDAPAVALGDVHQLARSDLDLLVEQGALVGRYPIVSGDVLRLVDLAGEGPPLPLDYGRSLHSAEIEVSQEPAFRSVESSSWRASAADSDRRTAERAGAGPDVRADPVPARVGGGGPLLRFDDVGERPGVAQAELDVRRAGEVIATLVAEGDPALRVGGRVLVTGVHAAVEGTYVVTRARHEIGTQGYETTLGTAPPAPPPPRAADRVTLGVVLDVEDPDDRGRARVQLPGYADLAVWAPVLLPAAGRDKGVVALPDVDDTVLVLLPAHDPGNAVVLGGLYGPHTAPSVPGAQRGTSVVARTADGQQVVLDGAQHSLAVTDGHGSRIELGPDLLRISAAADLLIEAPGRAMTIRAKSVDFEEAP